MSKASKSNNDLQWYMKHLHKEDILSPQQEKEVCQQLETARKEGVLQCYPVLSNGFRDYFSGEFSQYPIDPKVSRKYARLEEKIRKKSVGSSRQKTEQKVYSFFQSINNWSYLRNILYLNRTVSPAGRWYAELHEAESALFASASRFAVSYAHHHGNHSVSLADRVQDANLGLLRALDSFEPGKGFRFLTYAQWWLRSSLQRSPSEEGTFHLPAHLQRALPKLLKMEWENQHRVVPYTAEEMKNKLDLSKNGLQHLQGAIPLLTPSSLEDYLVGNKNDSSPGLTHSMVISDSSAEEKFKEIQKNQQQKKVQQWFEKVINAGILTDREVGILNMRFGFSEKARKEQEGETLKVTGKKFHISRERVRQVENMALRKLRHSEFSEELKEIMD